MRQSFWTNNENAGAIIENNGYDRKDMFCTSEKTLNLWQNQNGAVLVTLTKESEEETLMIWCDDMQDGNFRFYCLKENAMC